MADGTGIRIGGVYVDVEANTKKVNSELVRTEQRARKTGGVMVSEFDRAERSADRLERTLKRGVSTLGLLAGGFTVGALATGVVQAADAMALLRGRIGQVLQDGERLDAVFNDIFNAAQRNRSGLQETAQLYLRLRNSIRELNHEQALGLTSTFAQTLAISGANAQEAAAATLQFAQAIGSGRLQGDELRSLLENNTRFARLLADALGVAVGELKALGEAGVLTTDIVRNAMATQAEVVSEEFGSIPLTVGQAFTQLQNSILKYVGDTDKSLGFSTRLAQGIGILTDNIDELGDALLVIGSASVAGAAALGFARLTQNVVVFSGAIREALSDLAAGTSPAYKRLAEQRHFLVLSLDKQTQETELARQAYEKASRTFRAKEIEGVTGRSLGAYKRSATITLQYLVDQERHLAALQDKADQVGAAYTKMERSIGGRFQQLGNVLGRLGGNLVNLFGGPVGIAIAAASVAMGVFVHNAQEAERRLRSLRGGLETVADLQLKTATSSSDAADAINDSTKALKALEEQTKLTKVATEALAEIRRKDAREQITSALAATAAQEKSYRERLVILNRALARSVDTSTGGKARKSKIEREIAELNKMIAGAEKLSGTFRDAISGIDRDMYEFGDGAKEAASDLTELEKALAAFNKTVELQRKAATPAKLKSSIIEAALGKLAEADLATARKQFEAVKDLLTPQDVKKVEANFRKITKVTLETKSALNEFRTEAEQFRQVIKDITQADPSDGNKSKAALQAVIDYGKELKNIPAAIAAIGDANLAGKLLKPEDAQKAREELGRVAREASLAFGSDATVRNNNFAKSLQEINEAEAALIATGQSFNPDDFGLARAAAAKQPLDDLDAQLDELDSLIREMLRPAEKLNEELSNLALLQGIAGEGSKEQQAIDRKRVELLEDQARAAGKAAFALATLRRLQGSAGLSPAEVRDAERAIRNAAAAGRAGMYGAELDQEQRREVVTDFFASTFSEGVKRGIQSGDFGEAFKEVIAQKAAEGLSDALDDLGQVIFKGGGPFDWLLNAGAALLGGDTGLPKKANGGRISGPTIVGERGWEVFIPDGGGQVYNQSQLRSRARAAGAMGGMGGGLTVHMGGVHVAGDVGTQDQLREIVRGQEELARQLPNKVLSIVKREQNRVSW